MRAQRSAWSVAAAMALLVAAPLQAHAYTQFDLRYFGLDTTSGGVITPSDDLFANGDPLTGRVYRPNGVSVAGGYNASSFSAGAELGAPAIDFAGQQFGVGSLRFVQADAVDTTSNLTPAGFAARSLTLSPAVVPNTALGLVRGNAGFEVGTVWNFTLPGPGESLLLGLGGNSTGLGSTGVSNYTGRVQIRFAQAVQGGAPVLLLEQQSRLDGVLSRTTLESHTLASLPVDLSQVDYLNLSLWRDEPSAGTPNPGVHGAVTFFDAAYDAVNDQPVVLYHLDFAATGSSFADGNFSGVFTSATWLSPVPEPSAAAMLLVSLACLAWLRRRRD